MNKIALIMVNINDYEYYREFNELENKDKIDFYYFSDKDIKSNFWKTININSIDEIKNLENRLKCKFLKMKINIILPGYDYYFWVDASFPINNNNFVNDLYNYINSNYELVLYKHNSRRKERNTKCEVKRCLNLKSVNKDILKKQYENYLLDGFVDKIGNLYSTGIIFRRNISKINNLFNFWYLQNEKYTTRDQVSLPYCLWKFNIEPEIISENINLNSLVGKKEMKSRKNR